MSKQQLSGYFKSDGQLKKIISGSIQDFLNVHTEVKTKSDIDGLARRILGQIKGFVFNSKENKGGIENMTADEKWHSWMHLIDYFQHEYEEDEITLATYETMTKCAMAFKPWVDIEFTATDR